jgi:hypothetical protein
MSTKEIEEGLVLAPKFDADGLVTASPPTRRAANC